MGIFERLRNQKKEPHTVPLSEALDLIKKTLQESPERRIREPFESPIAIGSITQEDLVQWADLDIELVATCPKNWRSEKRVILLTGKPLQGGPDWPDEAFAAKTKADRGDALTEDERLTAKGLKDDAYASHERATSPLAYRLHNHPGGYPRPSLADISLAAGSQCNIDMILTSSEVIFYAAHWSDVLDAQIMHDDEQDEYIDSKLVITRIPLSDPRMATVRALLNQEISWDKARRTLAK